MKREFVRTNTFDRNWTAAGLNDDNLRELEILLLENAKAGDVIPHLNGARKLRVSVPGKGKRGGARVIYVDVLVQERIYLLLAYPKNVQTDLTQEQRELLCGLIDTIKEEL